MRILVAEDDLLSARLLEAQLRADGYEVVSAANGLEAWEILQSDKPPQMAIVDWVMPGIDGLEICRRIRQAGGPYIYVFLLTSNTDAADVVAGIEAGADDYIKKPFNPAELQARLRSGKRIVELQEQLRVQATHDALTGLLNWEAILKRFAVELTRAAREQTVLSVAMIDLDHFKQVNDTYGHSAGDTVLREVAARLLSRLRPYDLIGRYGGEEFIFILPRCDLATAGSIAERLLVGMSAEPISIGWGQVKVTASIGIASSSAVGTADSLIREADAALFKAKSRGRNRVELARSATQGT